MGEVADSMIEIIHQESESAWLELRTRNINSTEISALFGISDYCTPYELWWRKKDQKHVRIEPNERMASGTHYQEAIANWFAKKNGWTIRRMDEYIQDNDLRIAASFDYINQNGELLEIKSVDGLQFSKNFTLREDGSVECPLQIEAQCQQELMISGAQVLWLCICVGGNTHYQIKRTPDIKVHEAIKLRVDEFWKSIDENTTPEPDFNQDASFIKELFGYAEPGTKLDVSNNLKIHSLATEYKSLGDQIKPLEERRDAIKAEILMNIGEVEKAFGDGFTISASMQGPTWIEAYERKGFRRFLISFKKEK